MARNKKLICIIILTGMTLIIGVATKFALVRSNGPLQPGEISWSEGYLLSGSKFGIAVGEEIDHARVSARRNGLDHYGSSYCYIKLQKLINCSPSQKVYFFGIDRILRHGYVAVLYDDNRVTAIVWNTHALHQIDF